MNSSIRFDSAGLLFCRSKFHQRKTQVIKPCILQAALMFGAASVQAAPDSNTLIVVATGFKNGTGHATAKLFAPSDNVLKKGRQEVVGAICGGQASMTFPALPSGDYAVVVFHDENENGTIDHNLLALPSEALGFSNNFAISLTSGLPSFEKLQFIHGQTAQTIFIRVE